MGTFRDPNVSKRILIIEDDRSLQTVLERMVLSVAPGATIDWTESAEQALINIRNTTYDLIIADIYLQGNLTGIEFWQTCQTVHPQTPLLFMSSVPVDRYFQFIGPNAVSPPYLPKPFRIGEGKQLIESLLQSKAA